MFNSITRFFVYSNLFIAACALLMLWQTSHFLLQRDTDLTLAGFVFFATLSSYSFHWWFTDHSVLPSDRIQWLSRNRKIHLVFFIAGLAGTLFFFIPLREYWPWLLGSALATFLYSAPKIPHPLFRSLRRWALGKTIFLAMVWMYATTILPIITAGAGWHPAYTLFVVGRFFFIYAICILFDYRDREDDREAGIRSLITYLSEKGITRLFYFSLLVFFLVTNWLLLYDYPLAGILLLLVPALITAILYNYARRHFDDLFYYFILDGLMALSAGLMWVAGV